LPVASMVSKLTYLAREATPGTRQPPNKYLAGPQPARRRQQHARRGPGVRLHDADGPAVHSGLVDLHHRGRLLPRLQLADLPAGRPAGRADDHHPGRRHALPRARVLVRGRRLEHPPAFTFATGYRGGLAEETIRNVFQSFNLGFSRTAAPTIGGGGYGRNLDLSASLGVNEIQTHDRGIRRHLHADLSVRQFTAGIRVQRHRVRRPDRASGARRIGRRRRHRHRRARQPGTPYVITFIGTKANTDVALMTIDSTNLTGGAHTDRRRNPEGRHHDRPGQGRAGARVGRLHRHTAGAIGTTKVKPYSGAFTFNGLVNPDWVIDSSLASYDDDVLQVPELSMNMVMRNDATPGRCTPRSRPARPSTSASRRPGR
jgi:hypothetical protein